MRWSLCAVVVGAVVHVGCHDRPVVSMQPCAVPLAISRISVSRVDKLDLLLVVDNSPSMADKHAELTRRIPELLAGLTDPAPDPVTGRTRNALDIHVGVITSSLGSHGTSACAVDRTNRTNDDRGHLLPRPGDVAAAGCPTPIAASPLTWAFRREAGPVPQFVGSVGAEQLATATSCVVTSAGDEGCHYAETWEALYHLTGEFELDAVGAREGRRSRSTRRAMAVSATRSHP